jgi:hypothetical protein
MKKGDKLVSLEAETKDPLATRNSILFAALCALGIPPEPDLCGEFVEEIGGVKKSVTVWRLRSQSLAGTLKTHELIKLWNDAEFPASQPEHPLAYMKAAFQNYQRAIDFVKDQGPIAMVRRGNKVALLTRHTSKERRDRIIDELNK